MNIPFIDLGRAYAELADELDRKLCEVAGSGAYVLGPNVAALEQAVADYLGVGHGIAVNSGTDALHLALAGLGIGPGDEVITTPFTFAATAEAIEYVGAKTVLVDIDDGTFNIDSALIEDALTEDTRAIMPVHIFGLPADMDTIVELADRHDLFVVEDCAQSFGSRWGGQPAGTFGSAGAYSFYPTKTLGGIGDGGMISTDDADMAARLRELRNHGIGERAEHVRLGFNSRLDELQAAVLKVKLERIDAMNDRRREIAARYNDAFAELGVKTQHVPSNAHHVYGYYTIVVDDRDALREKLREAGIATALYYPKPLHHHKHFSKTCRFGQLDVVERISAHCLSLPVFPELSDAEVDYVVETTKGLL